MPTQRDEIDREVKLANAKMKKDLQAKIHQEVDQEIADHAERADLVTTHAERVAWFTDRQLIQIMPQLRADLGWLFVVGSMLLIPINIYRAYYAAFVSKEAVDNRILQFVAGVGGFLLGALSIIVVAGAVSIATPLLMLIGCTKATIDNIWDLSLTIKERIEKGRTLNLKIQKQRESLTTATETNAAQVVKLTELINAKRELNTAIAEKSHVLLIGVGALIATVFLFTPAFPIATIALVALGVYGVMDALKLNPLREFAKFVARKSNSPFQPLTVQEVYQRETKGLSPPMNDQTPAVKPQSDSETSIFHSLAGLFPTFTKKSAKKMAESNIALYQTPDTEPAKLDPKQAKNDRSMEPRRDKEEGETDATEESPHPPGRIDC